jgi:hypothetical protein
MTEQRRFSLEAAAALAPHRLVKLSSGKAAYNTAAVADEPIGINEIKVALGEIAGGRFLNEPGTVEIEAAGAITAGADVFAAADGKIQALPTDGGAYLKIGIAMKAASGSGSIIEVLPVGLGEIEYVTETITASGALSVVPGVASQLDSTGGAITGTLADGSVIGQKKFIVMTDASNSSTVSIAHHVTSDPEVATFNAVDEFLELVWTGTEWETVKASATFV